MEFSRKTTFSLQFIVDWKPRR